MSAPSVLVERTFIQALIDAAHDRHQAARLCYSGLVDRYERNEIRLRARADHLGTLDPQTRRTVFAPVESISVAEQFRRQARRLRLPSEPARTLEIDDDLAVTLVVLRRERIRSVAAYHPTLATFDVAVVG